MESSQIALLNYCDVDSKNNQFCLEALHKDKLKLDHLSRNVLIVISEYLCYIELVILTSSTKKIMSKLDKIQGSSCEESYYKKRSILHFQSFFFQQFAASDQFYQRMSSITSCSTMTSSCFLPLTKSPSLQFDQSYPLKFKQLSTQSFQDFSFDSHRLQQKSPTVDSMDYIENNYLEETYDMWRLLFIQAHQNKKNLVQKHKDNFYSVFLQEAEDYAKEIFLDPSLCENPCFALPQLTRENYTQKGLFYRTEKVLVQNYYNCFQKYSVDYTKQLLWDVNRGMQDDISQNIRKQYILKSLIKDCKESDSSTISVTHQGEPNGHYNNNQDVLMEDLEIEGEGYNNQLELALAQLEMTKGKSMSGLNVFTDYSLTQTSDDIGILY